MSTVIDKNPFSTKCGFCEMDIKGQESNEVTVKFPNRISDVAHYNCYPFISKCTEQLTAKLDNFFFKAEEWNNAYREAIKSVQIQLRYELGMSLSEYVKKSGENELTRLIDDVFSEKITAHQSK